MSVRTLGRIVRNLERSTAASREMAAAAARFDPVRAATDRVMACPEVHLLAIKAADWMLDNAPLGADPGDYPVVVEMIEEAARLSAALEATAALPS